MGVDMEGAMQLLSKAVATIVFIIAVTLFLILNDQERKMLQSINNNINSQRVIGEGSSFRYEITTHGYDIIGEILSYPEYIVTIEGKDIDIYDISDMEIEEINIDMKGSYRQSLVINQVGEVVQVIYHKN